MAGLLDGFLIGALGGGASESLRQQQDAMKREADEQGAQANYQRQRMLEQFRNQLGWDRDKDLSAIQHRNAKELQDDRQVFEGGQTDKRMAFEGGQNELNRESQRKISAAGNATQLQAARIAQATQLYDDRQREKMASAYARVRAAADSGAAANPDDLQLAGMWDAMHPAPQDAWKIGKDDMGNATYLNARTGNVYQLKNENGQTIMQPVEVAGNGLLAGAVKKPQKQQQGQPQKQKASGVTPQPFNPNLFYGQ